MSALLPEQMIGAAILLAWCQPGLDGPLSASALWSVAKRAIERNHPGTDDEVRERWVRAMAGLMDGGFVARSRASAGGVRHTLVLEVTPAGREFAAVVARDDPDLVPPTNAGAN